MAFNRYHQIEELLELGMYTASIKVKVSRRWVETLSQTGPVNGISMFLTDKSNYRIYCWIPSNLAKYYSEDLEEDKSYEIHNFMISSYRSSCKWAENDEFFMILMNSTIVLPLQRDDCITAKETFNFKDYSHLDQQHLQGNHCIDVIGIVLKKGTMDFFTNKHNEEEIFLDFEITNTITKKTIRFRNEMAKLCNNSLKTWNDQDGEPTTISISSCKMQFNRYTNDVIFIDSPSTRFFINYESEQHTMLKQRYLQMRNARTSLCRQNLK